jgi:hypothetical protein
VPAEDDVPPRGEGPGAHASGETGGIFVAVNADATEVEAEAALDVGAQVVGWSGAAVEVFYPRGH